MTSPSYVRTVPRVRRTARGSCGVLRVDAAVDLVALVVVDVVRAGGASWSRGRSCGRDGLGRQRGGGVVLQLDGISRGTTPRL